MLKLGLKLFDVYSLLLVISKLFFFSFLGKAINGSTFINIRLRLGRNCYERIEDRVRNVATRVLGRTATSVDGKEIYMRTFPSVPTKTGRLNYVLK